MGMEKLGTKGPAFIAPITMRTKFSLSFNFRNLDPYKFWILKKLQEKKKEKNFFDEVETPRVLRKP
jgi:phosphatidylglycerophosphatase A